jgi:hypothetical protein
MTQLSSLLSGTTYIVPQGPEGPQGPIGPAGPQGSQGAPGIDGVDGAQGAQGIAGAGMNGPAGNYIVVETDTHLTGNYTVTSGKNALTAGPIIVDDGFAITVPDDSTWTVV